MAHPALFVVVPGDTLSAAAGELLSGRLTTGAVRLVFAFFTLALLVIGIVAATGVTGHGDALTETLPPPELPLAVVLLGWSWSSAASSCDGGRGRGPRRDRHARR